MLAKKFEGNLAKTVIEPDKAFAYAEAEGVILSSSSSWHRTIEKDEVVDMAEFMFLVSHGGKPTQVEVTYEKGEFVRKLTDLSKEMGETSEEEEFLNTLRFPSDGDILATLEKDERVQNALKKAKHLRLYSMDFVIFDDTHGGPVWHILLKNWPLTNYFKREKPMTVEAVVDGIKGKVKKLAVYRT
ncbi:MAG: hypothetical protein GOU98_00195 [Candidatus Altiarchaeota archaeon]|nr:hypothetical protein [Candidatus Altiarchaeota archaeon]